MSLPRLYAIADVDVLARHALLIQDCAEQLRAAGVTLLQLRNKTGDPQQILSAAKIVHEAFAGTHRKLILNDRADLARLAGFDGVHVGQEDLPVADVRRVLGQSALVGLSTHTDEQVRAADRGDADYIAVGPVFATGTKADASPVVGLDAVRRARALTRKPLVAIGGITRANARMVIDAGADSVAVISGILVPGEPIAKVARDFLDLLR